MSRSTLAANSTATLGLSRTQGTKCTLANPASAAHADIPAGGQCLPHGEMPGQHSWTGKGTSPLGRLQVQSVGFFRCLEGAWSHAIPDADDAREARGEGRGKLCIAELCSCGNAVHLLPWSIDAHQSAAHSQEGCPPE
mmetsp:Transcript_65136/g.190569  ORF Transcript_65136/g.190569 Transcript_65136/m.190569 type:complete len:138 (-) Transcript_65136:816-1229(-)